MRKLPANMNLQKDARTALTKATTVFINYLASAYFSFVLIANYQESANDINQSEKHTVIQPKDVFAALESLQLESFIPVLTAELQGISSIFSR